MDKSSGSMKTAVGTVGSGSRQSAGEQPAEDLSMGGAPTLRGGSPGRIDQYELIRELGGGGFGVVYLARDTVAGIEVAVKGLPPLVKNNAEELERIRGNFALVSRLHHPNIAAALVLHPAKEVSYAYERARQALRVLSGDYLMVMAFAPGVTLSMWQRQFPDGRVPVGQALEVCRQIASALDYAHGERVVHRDVKPGNVMVESREKVRGNKEEVRGGGTLNSEVVVRVLDFGLAAEIRSSMSRVSQEKGDTSGTRPYMAPEQWAGRRQDGRADQYALAALFYELVSGAVPFSSAFDTGAPAIMANAALNLRPEPLPELNKAQNDALLRGLAKEPGERFATCGEFAAALGNANIKPQSAQRHGGKKAALWLAVAAAVAVMGYGAYRAYGTYSTRRAEERAQAEQAEPLDAAGGRASPRAEIPAEPLDAAGGRASPRAEIPAEPLDAAGGRASPRAEIPAPAAEPLDAAGGRASPRAEIPAPAAEPLDAAGGRASPRADAPDPAPAEVKAAVLEIRLAIEGGDRVYRSGEKVAFAVQANQDCHLGLVCHQPDGSVVVLFPNPYHPDSRVKAGERTRIPGEADPAFEIVVGPPYGQDRVEAIACAVKSDLHALLEKAAGGSRQGYVVLERGMFVESVGKLEKTASLDGRQQNMARVEILLRTQK